MTHSHFQWPVTELKLWDVYLPFGEIVISSLDWCSQRRCHNSLRSRLQAAHKTLREMTCETSHVKLWPVGAENEMVIKRCAGVHYPTSPGAGSDLILITTAINKELIKNRMKAILVWIKKKKYKGSTSDYSNQTIFTYRHIFYCLASYISSALSNSANQISGYKCLRLWAAILSCAQIYCPCK